MHVGLEHYILVSAALFALGLLGVILRRNLLVLYMGLGRLEETARSLVAAGREPETPVAVIAHATRPTQRTVIGTLATIAEDVARADLPAPALIVVGEVVSRAVPRTERPALLARVG